MAETTTVIVTTTPAEILRAAALGAREDQSGADTFARIARAVDELGFAIVSKHDAVLGPVAVTLAEAPNHTPVEDDDGATAGLPTWPLSSGVRLIDQVLAWPDGLEFGDDGALVDDAAVIAAVEQDALAVLAAIATHRRAARRAATDTEEAGRG